MRLFGRESRVEKHFREHAQLVYECVWKLQELMPLFYRGDFDSLKDKVEEMSILEHEADEIRRIMEIEFFKGAFLVDNFNVGNASGKTGSYTLANSKYLKAGSVVIGNEGTGTLTQSGGTMEVTGTMSIAKEAGSTGTYNLNGGFLKAGTIDNAGLGVGTFNFNGGRLSVDNI